MVRNLRTFGFDKITTILSLIATVSGVVVPTYLGIVQKDEERIAKRRLIIEYLPVTPTFLDAVAGGPIEINVQMKFRGKTYNDIYDGGFTLINASLSPILPSDIYQPIRVSVPAPWKILDVVDADVGPVRLVWNKINDREFEALPALLNPDDRDITKIYMTNPNQRTETSYIPATKAPKFNVTTRISNLKSLTVMPLFSYPKPSWMRPWWARPWGVFIDLSGWAVVYFFVIFAVFQSLYVNLSMKAKLIRRSNKLLLTILVIVSGVLSMMAADCSADYIFGTILDSVYPVNNWLNISGLTINVITIVGLFMYINRTNRIEPAPEPT